MLFDEQSIEAAHMECFSVSCNSLMLGAIGHSASIIWHANLKLTNASKEQLIVSTLGTRLVNSFGSCMKLAGAGYFGPAYHQLRDIAETSHTLDYFALCPEKILPWSEIMSWDRVDKYSFSKIEKILRTQHNLLSPWKDRFERYSELGTHTSAAGAYAIVSDGQWQIGPHIDSSKFVQILFELGVDSCEATHSFINTRDKFSATRTSELLSNEHQVFTSARSEANRIYFQSIAAHHTEVSNADIAENSCSRP